MKLLSVLLISLCVCYVFSLPAKPASNHWNSNKGNDEQLVKSFQFGRRIARSDVQLSSSDTSSSDIKQWFKENPWIYGIIGGVALLILGVIVLLIICVYCYRSKRGPRQKNLDERRRLLAGVRNEGYSKLPTSRAEIGVDEELNRQKRKQQSQDREKAVMAVNFYLRNTQDYELETHLSDMGSRIQKYWFKISVNGTEGVTMLLSIAPVSQRCPLKLDQSALKTMKNLFTALRGHPFIHPINEIEYFQEQVIIVQPFYTRGSLKDVIYRAASTTDWSLKYSRRSKGLPVEKVANYGRQVLEAMVFLYKKGFPVLGHVQSGNIFVQDRVCRLGGYENTLLGYKTRLYKLCKEHMEHIDVIMFGHLMFEMACGYELTALVPGEQEYKSVKTESIKSTLRFIFEDGFPHTIEEILSLEFFQFGKAPNLEHFDPNSVKLTSSMKSLLKQAGKGKAQKQKAQKKLSAPSTEVLPSNTQSSFDIPKASGDELAGGDSQDQTTSDTGKPKSGQ